VRDLTRPETLKSAIPAALASALLGWPRLLLWHDARLPTWRLEGILFLGSVVLWSFVFAWHTKYSRRPVLVFRPGWMPFASATIAGLFCAIGRKLLLDPALRDRMPAEFALSGTDWVATLLFSLGFAQLMLVFSPFAWFVRLCHRPGMAAILTVLFGTFVIALKFSPHHANLPGWLYVGVLLSRVVSSALAVFFYLRGGVLLVSWMQLLIEIRLLPGWTG